MRCSAAAWRRPRTGRPTPSPRQNGTAPGTPRAGVANTRARLTHHYGANYRFEFHKRPRAFAVLIVLPWKAETPHSASRVA